MKTIGGFFELEIPYRRSSWHSLALPVNSARNGFEYILRSRKPAKVYLPNYICNSMLQPLNVCDVAYEFYNINNQLEINKKPDVSENELLLYVNYYGIKRDYCKKLYKEYGNHLVIDSTQAFFEKPLENVDTIYSTRKFFGVSDGGYLYTKSKEIEIKDQDISVERVRHLVGRLESSASDYYVDYRKPEPA